MDNILTWPGIFKGDKLNFERLWAELTDELNASGPWKTVWSDLRLGVKQKLAHNKFEVQKTGSGLFNKYVLSPIDEQIALISGLYASVDGVKNAKTIGLPSKGKEFYNNKDESTAAMASAPMLPSTSTSTSTFSIEDLENVEVASPEKQPVERRQNEAFASTSPKPTQVSNRKRKRHTSDVDDVLNMEAEHFSEIWLA